MGIPLDSVSSAVKVLDAVRGDVAAPIRVAVFVDSTATPYLIETVREALVPQTTSGLVRVERLGETRAAVKDDTDVVLVLSCGSERLQARVQELVVCGAPVAVLAESSVEVPFIEHDTPMLGLVAATDAVHLLSSLARWILDRTDKDTAFAANFPFMRIAAARHLVGSAAVGNLACGALFFIPGADFPVMTAAQLGMMLRLAAVFGRPLRPERAWEAAAVVAGAVALRAVARAVAPRAGVASFAVKAALGGAGTYAMGLALMAFYERDVDYTRANEALGGLVARVRRAIGGAVQAPVPA